AIINHAEQFFKQGKFLYANTGEQLQGQHQLDQFLFSKKVGYSQHYASSLTLLLRAAKIPARLVAGYRGAEKVGLTNLYAVNESHAHAWVEAYYENSQGQSAWQRIDPALWLSDLFSSAQESNADQNATQELSAQQIAEQKAKPSIASEQAQKQIVKKGKGKANESSNSWLDSLNQWTLDFDANKQSTLASKLGIKHLLWWHLVAIALGLLLLLALTIYLSLRYINRGKKLAPHSQVYHKLCKKLAKKGIIRLPHEGAQSYFARCAVEQSLQAQCFNSLSQHYLQLAYGKLNPQQQKQMLTQFKHLASQI
ncbi:MAG: transglutaminase domain-containing protein, partial [Colwellia sp.]|nr:transglutaminase domain-containing protein [Colwellia sp.]